MNIGMTELTLILGTLLHTPLVMEPADLACAARNAYHEARDQGAKGMHAVTYVASRRLKTGRWGASFCQVVEAPGQFSWTQDGKPDAPTDMAAYRRALAAVVDVVLGRVPDPSREASHYYAHDLVQPGWAASMIVTARVGGHTFATDCKRLANAPLCAPKPPRRPT